MNVDKLIEDLNDVENEVQQESPDEDIFNNWGNTDQDTFSSINKDIANYFPIFNIKNEHKKTQIYAEQIQISIINDLIFLLKLKKHYNDSKVLQSILECLNVSFKSKNESIIDLSQEKSLFIYKQHLLKNKYLFLKIIRRMKNKHFYPEIKQCIKDITRDVFLFNKTLYHGSLGFEKILFFLYKLINKHLQSKIKNFLLSFFILSILSRTNNSVDILYILEYFYKNDNFAFVMPNSSFLSPCQLSIYKNIIILKSNIKYFINLSDQTSLPYNCYNIIYMDANNISDNFYVHIYKYLLKQDKYHYIFHNKLFEELDFFNIPLNYAHLKGEECFSPMDAEEGLNKLIEHNLETSINKMEISSDSTYDFIESDMDIYKINEMNKLYLQSNKTNHKMKNFFYQFLIIELN